MISKLSIVSEGENVRKLYRYWIEILFLIEYQNYKILLKKQNCNSAPKYSSPKSLCFKIQKPKKLEEKNEHSKKTKTELKFSKFHLSFFFPNFWQKNVNNINIAENKYWILELTEKNADSRRFIYFFLDDFLKIDLFFELFKGRMEGLLYREREAMDSTLLYTLSVFFFKNDPIWFDTIWYEI